MFARIRANSAQTQRASLLFHTLGACAMNWSRGFLRLWIVASVLWTAFVITISWGDVPSPSASLSELCRYDASVSLGLDDDQVVEWLLKTAKHEQSREGCPSQTPPPATSTEAGSLSGQVVPQSDLPPSATSTEAGSPLLTDDEISAALSDFRRQRDAYPGRVRDVWLSGVGIAAIPIALVFALGWSVLWALSGFRDKRQG